MAQGRLELAASFDSSELHSAPLTGADFLSDQPVWQKKPSTKEKRELYHRGLKPTPVDPMTGIAYPIMPYEGTLTEENSSEHHAAHKRSRRELMEVENGVVTRVARMQRVYGAGGSLVIGNKLLPHHTPHQRYHYFFSGPKTLPDNPHEQFKYGIWASALYVPEYGLDVSGDKSKLKKMYSDQMDRLRDQLYVGSIDTVRLFSRQYVIENGVPHTSPEDIDMFMNTEDMEQRVKLGKKILDAASRVVSEPLESDFGEAIKRGTVQALGVKCMAEVVQLYITWGNQQKLVRQLSNAIAA